MRGRILIGELLTIMLLSGSAAVAQDERPNAVSVQGTGFFTKDSEGNGIVQHATDTGGLLVGYRLHFNRWLAAEATYGYDRNTQQNFTAAGPLNVQANEHQAVGALVVSLPRPSTRVQPYALTGVGALVFDPTGNPGGVVSEAVRQTKAAFVYGGGVDFQVTSQLYLRTEYRGLVYMRPDFGLTALNSDVAAHTAMPSVGFVFRF